MFIHQNLATGFVWGPLGGFSEPYGGLVYETFIIFRLCEVKGHS